MTTKPRIRFLMGDVWRCESREFKANGHGPAAAYKAWLTYMEEFIWIKKSAPAH